MIDALYLLAQQQQPPALSPSVESALIALLLAAAGLLTAAGWWLRGKREEALIVERGDDAAGKPRVVSCAGMSPTTAKAIHETHEMTLSMLRETREAREMFRKDITTMRGVLVSSGDLGEPRSRLREYHDAVAQTQATLAAAIAKLTEVADQMAADMRELRAMREAASGGAMDAESRRPHRRRLEDEG